MGLSNDIFALRKQGRGAEALEAARAGFQPQLQQDVWYCRAYGWALYDHLKHIRDQLKNNHISSARFEQDFRDGMREFVRISEPVHGDMVFDSMVNLALSVKDEWSKFLEFAMWATLDHLSDQAKQDSTLPDGKKLDSLHKRLTMAVCRATADRMASHELESQALVWGQKVLAQALDDHPADLWLPYYQTKILLSKGQNEQALKCLAPVLWKQKNMAWAWAKLGEILAPTRPEDAIVAFTHATHLAQKAQEVGSVRPALAELLAQQGRYPEAAYQIQKTMAWREQEGFKLPNSLIELTQSQWYQQVQAEGSATNVPKVDKAALDLLRQLDMNYTLGYIDHINAEKQLSYVGTGVDSGVALSHKQFKGLATLPVGTVVEVGTVGSQPRPMDWRRSQQQEIPHLLQRFTGVWQQLEGKPFAFIRAKGTDIYVSPRWVNAESIKNGDTVQCLASYSKNKAGKVGWQALMAPDLISASQEASGS